MRRLVGFALIVLAVLVPPLSANAESMLRLAGGAGTIRADRVWAQGNQICYDSRGYQACLPAARVSHIRGDQPALASPATPPPKPVPLGRLGRPLEPVTFGDPSLPSSRTILVDPDDPCPPKLD